MFRQISLLAHNVRLLRRYCGTVSGVRKLTREEVEREPLATAQVQIDYDDGETHWGLVWREPPGAPESGSRITECDDAFSSEAAVPIVQDRTVRLFVGRAPATPAKIPVRPYGCSADASMVNNETAKALSNAVNSPICQDKLLRVPETCEREWDKLSKPERAAALRLGWTSQLWGNLWRACQRDQPLTLVCEPTLTQTRTPRPTCDKVANGTDDPTKSTKRRCVATMTTVESVSVSVQTSLLDLDLGATVGTAATCSICSCVSEDTSTAPSLENTQPDVASSSVKPKGAVMVKADRSLQRELTLKLQTIETERKRVLSLLKQTHLQRMHAQESSVRLDQQRSMGVFDAKQAAERKQLQEQHEMATRQLVQGTFSSIIIIACFVRANSQNTSG